MTATLDALQAPTVPLDLIRTHPANPRRDAYADESLVASVRAQGVLDPVMVAPAPDNPVEWILIDGHRRFSAAGQAGLNVIPVNPRHDLVTEAQQVEVMVVTGLQKALLTPVEEAAGYEQLALLGMDEAAIAERVGYGVRRVHDRLRLNELPEKARTSIHEGQLSLVDAAALMEFEDDHEAFAAVEAAVGSSNFQYVVQQHRGRRDRTARNQSILDDFQARGIDDSGVLGTRHLSSWMYSDSELTVADAHEGCLAYTFSGDMASYSEPELVCTDPVKHGAARPAGADLAGDPSAEAERQAERDRAQAERDARREKQEAAARVRARWLADHLAGMFPTKSHKNLAEAARVTLPLVISFDGETNSLTYLNAFDLISEDLTGHQATVEAHAQSLTAATPTKVLAGLGGFLAAQIVEVLDYPYYDTSDDVTAALAIWDWMKSAGYPMSDVDVETVTNLESKLIDLTSEDGGDE